MNQVKQVQESDIKIIDFTNTSNDEKLACIEHSLSQFGFLAIKNYGIDLDLINRCYQLSREFFSSDQSLKNDLLNNIIDQKKYGNVGYYAFRSEQAQKWEVPDLKEFFHIGPTVSADSYMNQYYPANVWPDHMPEFKSNMLLLYREYAALAQKILTLLLQHTGSEFTNLQTLLTDGNSILRTLHYPPINMDNGSAMRAAPHTGINLIGLQPKATHSGLQFYTPNNEWVELGDGFEGVMTINIGEMLSYLTGGQLKPTLHQVVNDSYSVDRYSIVFFFHPNSTKKLALNDSNLNEKILAGEWLQERLFDINASNRK